MNFISQQIEKDTTHKEVLDHLLSYHLKVIKKQKTKDRRFNNWLETNWIINTEILDYKFEDELLIYVSLRR